MKKTVCLPCPHPRPRPRPRPCGCCCPRMGRDPDRYAIRTWHDLCRLPDYRQEGDCRG